MPSSVLGSEPTNPPSAAGAPRLGPEDVEMYPVDGTIVESVYLSTNDVLELATSLATWILRVFIRRREIVDGENIEG